MKTSYIPSLLAVIACSVLIFVTLQVNGCSVGKVFTKEAEVTTVTPSVAVSIEKRPSASFQGKTVKLESDTYHSSLGNLWSTDPGETISITEPLKYENGANPAIDIGPNGVSSTKTGGGVFTGASGDWGVLDTIWSSIKKFLWLGTLGFAGLLILYFLVPAAQPIIGGIFRAIASVIPIVGSLVERIFSGLKWKKPLEETVIAGQKFKDTIKASADLTLEQKTYITNLFNETMMQKQDEASQKTIKEIKINNNL